jgi:hypothetical protein
MTLVRKTTVVLSIFAKLSISGNQDGCTFIFVFYTTKWRVGVDFSLPLFTRDLTTPYYLKICVEWAKARHAGRLER